MVRAVLEVNVNKTKNLKRLSLVMCLWLLLTLLGCSQLTSILSSSAGSSAGNLATTAAKKGLSMAATGLVTDACVAAILKAGGRSSEAWEHACSAVCRRDWHQARIAVGAAMLKDGLTTDECQGIATALGLIAQIPGIPSEAAEPMEFLADVLMEGPGGRSVAAISVAENSNEPARTGALGMDGPPVEARSLTETPSAKRPGTEPLTDSWGGPTWVRAESKGSIVEGPDAADPCLGMQGWWNGLHSWGGQEFVHKSTSNHDSDHTTEFRYHDYRTHIYAVGKRCVVTDVSRITVTTREGLFSSVTECSRDESDHAECVSTSQSSKQAKKTRRSLKSGITKIRRARNRRALAGEFYSNQTPIRTPVLFVLSKDAKKLIMLSGAACDEESSHMSDSEIERAAIRAHSEGRPVFKRDNRGKGCSFMYFVRD